MAGVEAGIAELLKRLEAVTARLESVESQLGGASSSSSSSKAPAAGGAAPAAAAADGPVVAWVEEFDNLVAETFAKYLAASEKVGNDKVKAQAKFFEAAVKAQRAFLVNASKSAKPSAENLGKLLAATSEPLSKTVETREKARGDAQWNHLSAVSEAVPILGWVTVEPTPGPYAAQFQGNAEFYTNKLLREYKGKDNDQVAWIEGLTGFLKGLVAYVKKYHTTGVSWNPKGGDAVANAAAAAGGSSSAAPAPPAGGPPPPPPAPAPGVLDSAPPKAAPAAALFSELNSKGEGVTAGLRKVTKDMKTKNRDPSERTSVVKDLPKKTVSSSSSAAAGPKKGTPKFELQGNKWVVEFQDNNKEIVIESPEPKQTVYIYQCTGSVINVKGKVNAITVDSCKRTGLVFESAIASVEVVNSLSIEIQVQNKVPAFAIDKSSGVQLYLSAQCLDAELVSSKSDQMNILIPGADGDLVELSVPEQFKTVVKNGALSTSTIEHI
eukprot:TRINITY_DN1649_c0_g1_i1.p2 TRINITY_DN1649_c0_g1~~TRINITY_DN1649_c0_g1_i1.p2  ORF type:complete len:535 (+),score=301.20 TRINITY_DN1649_c0_g1_i1:122-1606(+)